MFSIISKLAGGVWVYAAVAIASAGATWYVTHGLDQRAYVELQLATEQAHGAAVAADMAALQRFVTAKTAADAKAADALAKLRSDRVVADRDFRAILTKEGEANAQLRSCLDLRLPDSVLNTLPR